MLNRCWLTAILQAPVMLLLAEVLPGFSGVFINKRVRMRLVNTLGLGREQAYCSLLYPWEGVLALPTSFFTALWWGYR